MSTISTPEPRRVALVTGANRGIGLEVSRQLAARGLQVVLTARDAEKASSAAASIGGAVAGVESFPLDVTRDDDAHALATWVSERFGRIDVLVNNAGILPERSDNDDPNVFEVPLDTIREAFETNTLGPLRVARALLPMMRRARYGRIVNVSSGMGQLSDMGGGYPAYRISKAALNAVTRLLHAELQDTGIKVNSVCPGWVRTDMGGPSATRSLEKGAETIVWLATLPDDGPSGGFFRDKHPIPW